MSTERNSSGVGQKTKKKKTAKDIIVIVLIVLIAILLLVFISGYIVFSHYYGKLNHQELKDDYEIVSQIDLDDDITEGEDSAQEDIDELENYLDDNSKDAETLNLNDKNVRNILLIGTDNRSKNSKGSRSDSMIIVSINSKTKQIVMTSIMRDVYVTIPGAGSNRINAAHAYGGVELLLDTIEANFKISIDEYVKVDFYSFMDVVDTIGGVTLDVTAAEIEVMQGYIRELNRLEGASQNKDMLQTSDAGRIRLNGKQALAYSRVRYVGGGDFGRTERQRKVLTAIMTEAKSSSLSELNDLANVLLPQVTTNLTQGDVLSLMMNVMDYLNYEIVSCRMPIDGSYKYLTIRGMSVLGVEFDKNTEYWYNAVYKGKIED